MTLADCPGIGAKSNETKNPFCMGKPRRVTQRNRKNKQHTNSVIPANIFLSVGRNKTWNIFYLVCTCGKEVARKQFKRDIFSISRKKLFFLSRRRMRENFSPLFISSALSAQNFRFPSHIDLTMSRLDLSVRGKKLFLYGGNGLTTSNPFADLKNLCVLAWFCTLDWKRSPTWCCVQKFATNSLVASVFWGNLLRLQRKKMPVQTPTASWVFLFHVLHMHKRFFSLGPQGGMEFLIFQIGFPRRRKRRSGIDTDLKRTKHSSFPFHPLKIEGDIRTPSLKVRDSTNKLIYYDEKDDVCDSVHVWHFLSNLSRMPFGWPKCVCNM